MPFTLRGLNVWRKTQNKLATRFFGRKLLICKGFFALLGGESGGEFRSINKGGKPAALRLAATPVRLPRRRFAGSASPEPAARARPDEERKLSRTHVVCITTRTREELRKSAAGEGRANPQRRNNKPPHMRGFEGLAGVDAPPAEVSGESGAWRGRIRDLDSQF